EPMNALLLLQMLKVAEAVTDDARFGDAYRRLIGDQGYGKVAERARAIGPPDRVNHSDDVLIALALYPLLELEQDSELRQHYLKAARRWFLGGEGYPGVSAEANPFANFLWRHWTGEDRYDSHAIETLRRMPLDMKWNRDTIVRYGERFEFRFDPGEIGPPPDSGVPLPIDRRPKTWSFLVQNPYIAGPDRAVDSSMEYQALDYTVSYWFGRAHGMIGED
ncbi:hypothetical protein IIC65_08540, partial [Candidatus Sumerlaeota bacterium]|nr:hypothetical protein [Candidatus Sumerlaeota bacterium]